MVEVEAQGNHHNLSPQGPQGQNIWVLKTIGDEKLCCSQLRWVKDMAPHSNAHERPVFDSTTTILLQLQIPDIKDISGWWVAPLWNKSASPWSTAELDS